MTTGGKIFIGFSLMAGSLLALAVIAFLVLALKAPTGVYTSSAISAEDKRMLREAKLLAAEEELIYLSTTASFEVRENGCFFTDRGVVSYHDADPVSAERALWSEVEDIQADFAQSMFDDTSLTILRTDGTRFEVAVSNVEGEDRRFFNRMVREWKTRSGRGGVMREAEAAP